MAVSKLLFRQIEEYIEKHKEEMIGDIITLCRIDSEKMPYKMGSPFGVGTTEALSQAISIAEHYGFSINNYDNYVVTADLFSDKEKRLDILAHLDVVPAGDGWTVTKAFDPVVKDGRIYGRGTADDKGPAMAALLAMRCVKDLGIPLTGNVRLIFGTDEESASNDIRHYYELEDEAPMTVSPDADFPVINVEKGRYQPVFHKDFESDIAEPGILSIHAGVRQNVVPGVAEAVISGLDDNLVRDTGKELTKKTGVTFTVSGTEGGLLVRASGATSHASKPEEGKNALTALLALLASLPFAHSERIDAVKALTALFPYNDYTGKALGIDIKDEISGRTSCTLSVLEMDKDEITFGIDARVPACATKKSVIEPVKKAIKPFGFALSTEEMVPAHVVSPDSLFVRTLLDAYKQVTGEDGYCRAIGGGTYVHDLKNGVAFGASMPKTDNRMHAADEFAEIGDLVAAAKIYAVAIAELCK